MSVFRATDLRNCPPDDAEIIEPDCKIGKIKTERKAASPALHPSYFSSPTPHSAFRNSSALPFLFLISRVDPVTVNRS
jgi:hypothetical protein